MEIESTMRLWRIAGWDDQLEFVGMVRALDHEYLTYLNEEREAKDRNKSKTKATS